MPCVSAYLPQDKDSEPTDHYGGYSRIFQGRSAYLKPSGSASRTVERNDPVLLLLAGAGFRPALRANRGSGVDSTPFWCLWPRTCLPLNEDGGAAPKAGESQPLPLSYDVFVEADLIILCREDEGLDTPDLCDVSSSVTGDPILALSNDGYADAERCGGDGRFCLPDLDGGLWDVFPSDWDGVGVGMDSLGWTGPGVVSRPRGDIGRDTSHWGSDACPLGGGCWGTLPGGRVEEGSVEVLEQQFPMGAYRAQSVLRTGWDAKI